MKDMCKFAFALLLILTLVAFPGMAEIRTLDFSFSPEDFTYAQDASGFTEIGYLGKQYHYGSTSEPGLPITAITIAVEKDTEITDYKIVNDNKVHIGDGLIVAPNPIPLPTDGSIEHSPWTWEDVKYPAESYPLAQLSVSGTSYLADVKLIHLWLTPFSYEVKSGTLHLFTKLTVNLEINETSESDKSLQLRNFDTLPVSAANLKWAKGEVYDNASLSLLEGIQSDPVHRIQSSVEGDARGRLEYVIITNEEIKESFESLAEWKTKKGVPTEIFTVENIYSLYSGLSQEIAIKNFLYDTYIEHPELAYVMLGGDDSVVPVAYCYQEITEKIDGNPVTCTRMIPSDLYFTVFEGNFNWDANKDGKRGDNDDNINFVPSMAITRLPVRTIEEVKVYSSRVLEYERSPKYNHNIFMGGRDLTYYDTDPDKPNEEPVAKWPEEASRMSERLYSSFRTTWDGHRRRLFRDSIRDFSYTDPRIRPYMINDALSKGFAFASFISHGGPQAWACDAWPNYTIEDAVGLDNPKVYTLLTTISCLTNAFDDDSAPIGNESFEDPCLSEAFIRNPKSNFIAYFGCSREGWYTPNTYGPSMEYEEEFYKMLFGSDTNKSLGYLAMQAKKNMIKYASSSPKNRYTFLQYGLNTVGDCELPIYIASPLTNCLTLSFDNHECSFSLISQKGLLCLQEIDGKSNSDYRILSGVANGTLNNLPLDFYLTATAPGYIPISKRIKILQNREYTSDTTITADYVRIGSAETNRVTAGNVIFSSGNHVIEGEEVFLGPGTKVIIQNK